MTSSTPILLARFEYALARHGREVLFTWKRAGGRGAFIPATQSREPGHAGYTIRALKAPSEEEAGESVDLETRMYSVLVSALPVVNGKVRFPGRGWTITDRVREGAAEATADQPEEFQVVKPGRRMLDGNVLKVTCVRKK